MKKIDIQSFPLESHLMLIKDEKGNSVDWRKKLIEIFSQVIPEEIYEFYVNLNNKFTSFLDLKDSREFLLLTLRGSSELMDKFSSQYEEISAELDKIGEQIKSKIKSLESINDISDNYLEFSSLNLLVEKHKGLHSFASSTEKKLRVQESHYNSEKSKFDALSDEFRSAFKELTLLLRSLDSINLSQGEKRVDRLGFEGRHKKSISDMADQLFSSDTKFLFIRLCETYMKAKISAIKGIDAFFRQMSSSDIILSENIKSSKGYQSIIAEEFIDELFFSDFGGGIQSTITMTKLNDSKELQERIANLTLSTIRALELLTMFLDGKAIDEEDLHFKGNCHVSGAIGFLKNYAISSNKQYRKDEV